MKNYFVSGALVGLGLLIVKLIDFVLFSGTDLTPKGWADLFLGLALLVVIIVGMMTFCGLIGVVTGRALDWDRRRLAAKSRKASGQ